MLTKLKFHHRSRIAIHLHAHVTILGSMLATEMQQKQFSSENINCSRKFIRDMVSGTSFPQTTIHIYIYDESLRAAHLFNTFVTRAIRHAAEYLFLHTMF